MSTHVAEQPGALARNWGLTLARGLAAIALGLAAFTFPGITLTALVWLWGAYAVIDGIAALVAAFAHDDQRWWHYVEGLAGIIAGVVAFALTGLSALLPLFIIAAWAIVTGVFEIIAAIRLRDQLRDEWILALAGFVSLVLGVTLASVPDAGLLVTVGLVGASALLFGISLVVLAFRERSTV